MMAVLHPLGDSPMAVYHHELELLMGYGIEHCYIYHTYIHIYIPYIYIHIYIYIHMYIYIMIILLLYNVDIMVRSAI